MKRSRKMTTIRHYCNDPENKVNENVYVGTFKGKTYAYTMKNVPRNSTCIAGVEVDLEQFNRLLSLATQDKTN